MEEEKKCCRLCETKRETGMHVMKECNYSGTYEYIIYIIWLIQKFLTVYIQQIECLNCFLSIFIFSLIIY